MGAPLRRLAGGRGESSAQRFTALRTRVERRTPSGAGSMASTSFLAFLAFLAAGFLAAFFAAGFFAAGFLPRAARGKKGRKPAAKSAKKPAAKKPAAKKAKKAKKEVLAIEPAPEGVRRSTRVRKAVKR